MGRGAGKKEPVSPRDGAAQQKQFLAGVFIDSITGNMMVEAAPGIMPYLLFLQAVQGWLAQAVEQERSKIIKAPGPLPRA